MQGRHSWIDLRIAEWPPGGSVEPSDGTTPGLFAGVTRVGPRAPRLTAPLTVLGRLRLARWIVEDALAGRPPRPSGSRSSRTTRGPVGGSLPCRRSGGNGATGPRGRIDPRGAPHHRSSARSCTTWTTIAARTRYRSPHWWGSPRSTRALRRAGRPPAGSTGCPGWIGPPAVLIRYEYPDPGGLVHVDVKKLGVHPIPGRLAGPRAGGHPRRQSRQERANHHRSPASAAEVRPATGSSTSPLTITPGSPTSRSHADETRHTAAAFWTRAYAWFAQHGITVQRVLTDNGPCYRSHPWRDTLAALGITHLRTRPPPATNQREGGAGSTAPCSTNGPTNGSTPANKAGAPPCQPGSTTTTITDHTPRSAATPPSAAAPTCQGRTPSGRDGRDHWPVPTLQSLADSDRLGVQALYGAVVGRTVEETQDI